MKTPIFLDGKHQLLDHRATDHLTKGVKTFPTNVLMQLFIEKMDEASVVNNSGILKVAVIYGRELERRGETGRDPKVFREYLDLCETAIADAESKR